MPEGTRYIDVPAIDLLTELRAIGESIKGINGQVTEGTSGQEMIVDFTPPYCRACVRVYTSLGIGRVAVRGCGQDAVRLILGTIYKGKFKPLGNKRRLYRTAPRGKRQARVQAFLERLKVAIRDYYREALHVPTCPNCDEAMALRSTKDGGRKFYGCVGYPDCKGTQSATNGKREA